MARQPVESSVQTLIDRHGASAVHAAWLAVWGWPATLTPSVRETLRVQEFLISKYA